MCFLSFLKGIVMPPTTESPTTTTVTPPSRKTWCGGYVPPSEKKAARRKVNAERIAAKEKAEEDAKMEVDRARDIKTQNKACGF